MLGDLFGLSGQVAIVTGALGRLGREYVRDAGAGRRRRRRHRHRRRSPRPFAPLAAEARPRSTSSSPISRARPTPTAPSARIAGALGAPTILVNNAGMGSSPAAAGTENGRFEDYPGSGVGHDDRLAPEERAVRVAGVRPPLPRRPAARPAASSTSRRPTAWCRRTSRSTNTSARGGATFFKPVGYSVAKSGVLNFTRWLAEYGAPLGIRANTLVPGGVREAGHAPEFVAEYEKRTPLGRMATEDGLQRRGAVPRLARLLLHDRRHARRRRRLDGSLTRADRQITNSRLRVKIYG